MCLLLVTTLSSAPPPAPSSLSTNDLAEEEEEAGSIVVVIGGVVQPQREPCCTPVCKCYVMLYNSYVHAGIDTGGGGTRMHLRVPIFRLYQSLSHVSFREACTCFMYRYHRSAVSKFKVGVIR